MKTLLFIASLATDSLPPLEMLFHSIDSFYLRKMETELAEFQFSKKGEWLKYVPTLGVTYTLDGRPRPAISFSSSVIYRARKDRQTIASKRRSIIGKNRLEAEALKEEVQEMVLRYYRAVREHELEKQIFDIDRQLFAIQQAEYERLELAPSEYLAARRRFLVKEQQFLSVGEGLRQLRRTVLTASHYQ